MSSAQRWVIIANVTGCKDSEEVDGYEYKFPGRFQEKLGNRARSWKWVSGEVKERNFRQKNSWHQRLIMNTVFKDNWTVETAAYGRKNRTIDTWNAGIRLRKSQHKAKRLVLTPKMNRSFSISSRPRPGAIVTYISQWPVKGPAPPFQITLYLLGPSRNRTNDFRKLILISPGHIFCHITDIL